MLFVIMAIVPTLLYLFAVCLIYFDVAGKLPKICDLKCKAGCLAEQLDVSLHCYSCGRQGRRVDVPYARLNKWR